MVASLCFDEEKLINSDLIIFFFCKNIQNIYLIPLLLLVGLPYLQMKGVYEDAFILHEDSNLCDVNEETDNDAKKTDMASKTKHLIEDPRKEMDDTWCRWWKFQPLWKIRNYFGEKIGLYFAWAGMLLTSLWLPMLFGLACFIYGLTVR